MRSSIGPPLAQVGGQVLVTTKLDGRKVRKAELSDLYARR
jgi:hypothetical protein